MSTISDVIDYDTNVLSFSNQIVPLTKLFSKYNPFRVNNTPVDSLLLEDYDSVYKVNTVYFLYLVSVVETEDGLMLKGSRIPDNNWPDLETAKKIYERIIYTDNTRVKVYLVQSSENFKNEEFLSSSRMDTNLDSCLPKQRSGFIVIPVKPKKD